MTLWNEVLRIEQPAVPKGVDGFRYIGSDGQPIVLLWSLGEVGEVRVIPTSRKPFQVKTLGAKTTRTVLETATVKLPQLHRRELKFASIETQISEGMPLVEIHGLDGDVVFEIP